jgi:quercetin dioxygenase-like cupin family protein
MPAILHVLQGEARLKLGADVLEVAAGAWARMEARLEHAIFAKSPTILLLTMLKAG